MEFSESDEQILIVLVYRQPRVSAVKAAWIFPKRDVQRSEVADEALDR